MDKKIQNFRSESFWSRESWTISIPRGEWWKCRRETAKLLSGQHEHVLVQNLPTIPVAGVSKILKGLEIRKGAINKQMEPAGTKMAAESDLRQTLSLIIYWFYYISIISILNDTNSPWPDTEDQKSISRAALHFLETALSHWLRVHRACSSELRDARRQRNEPPLTSPHPRKHLSGASCSQMGTGFLRNHALQVSGLSSAVEQQCCPKLWKTSCLHRCMTTYPQGRDRVQSLSQPVASDNRLGNPHKHINSFELLFNGDWLMLNKYLQIIITIGLYGKGKTKAKDKRKKNEGAERMWKK